jgi:diadenosine tetraphosphate (Ap4A) HIT family hydrolase
MHSRAPFLLHPQLQKDTHYVARLELSQLLVIDDSHYPWFVLVPERADITEWFELDPNDQHLLLKESIALSQALKSCFNPDKINVAAIGNMVPQLHLHHVVRYRDDAVWPAPVWGALPLKRYPQGEWDSMAQRVLKEMEDHLT